MLLVPAAISAPAITTPSAPASASASAPVANVQWQGVTLGESTSAVLARLGRPALRRKAIMGTYIIEYEALGGLGTLSLTDSEGAITGIRLIAADPSMLRSAVADPFGVALGDTADRLTDLRGQPQRYDDEGGGEFTSYYGKPSEVRWAYGLRNDVIYSIGVIAAYRVVRASGAVVAVATPRPTRAPNATPTPAPDASGLDRAIHVTPAEIEADPQFEFDYVRRQPCGAGDRWAPLGETIVNAKHKNFSRIDAACQSTDERRSFFFDITDVFGREP